MTEHDMGKRCPNLKIVSTEQLERSRGTRQRMHSCTPGVCHLSAVVGELVLDEGERALQARARALSRPAQAARIAVRGPCRGIAGASVAGEYGCQ